MSTPHDLDKHIESVLRINKLAYKDLAELCEQVRLKLLEESNVRIVNPPCTIVGDIHGQFLDMLEMFEVGMKAFLQNYYFDYLSILLD